MAKNILFRVDAGGKIGLGHFFRSMTLANELASNSYEISFTFRSSDFWDKTMKSGFKYTTYPLSENDLYVSELDIIKYKKFDLIYVDGFINYAPAFLKKIKAHNIRIVFYQNLTDSRIYSDVFILPSIHQKESFFNAFNDSTKVYSGLKYFTFSEKLLKLDKKSYESGEINSVAITGGGSDPKNVLLTWYHIFINNKFDNLKFTFYYGVDYLHKTTIPKALKENIIWEEFNHRAILKNDLLISAFGVSTYEFLVLGMLVITFGHKTDNAMSSEFLANQTKALISLGLMDNIDVDTAYNSLAELSNNPAKVIEMVNRGNEILDLRGVKRVSDIIKAELQDG
jgi:spore coat polysaccharide biosynthesis predicted glycosyltransferase SpsG